MELLSRKIFLAAAVLVVLLPVAIELGADAQMEVPVTPSCDWCTGWCKEKGFPFKSCNVDASSQANCQCGTHLTCARAHSRTGAWTDGGDAVALRCDEQPHSGHDHPAAGS